MTFKYQTIWQSDNFQPFECKTIQVFRSPLYLLPSQGDHCKRSELLNSLSGFRKSFRARCRFITSRLLWLSNHLASQRRRKASRNFKYRANPSRSFGRFEDQCPSWGSFQQNKVMIVNRIINTNIEKMLKFIKILHREKIL